jgi:hypothetical protein
MPEDPSSDRVGTVSSSFVHPHSRNYETEHFGGRIMRTPEEYVADGKNPHTFVLSLGQDGTSEFLNNIVTIPIGGIALISSGVVIDGINMPLKATAWSFVGGAMIDYINIQQAITGANTPTINGPLTGQGSGNNFVLAGWASAGSIGVTIEATSILGIAYTIPGVINVVAPVVVVDTQPTIGTNQIVGESLTLSGLGAANGGTTGIVWNVSATAAGGFTGTVGFVQLCAGFTSRESVNGTVQQIGSEIPFLDFASETQSIWYLAVPLGDDIEPITFADEPAVALQDGYKAYRVSEVFAVVVAYQAAVASPLVQSFIVVGGLGVSWTFNSAVALNAQGQFEMTSGQNPVATLMEDVTWALPGWSQNSDDFQFPSA